MLDNVVDISHYQKNTVGFEAVKKSGIVGVIHKATEGPGKVDEFYHARKPMALAAGLLWGAYHFGTTGNIPAQVDHFLETANPAPADLIALDFEPNYATMTLAEAEEFVSLIEQKLGRYPLLYTNAGFIREKLGNNTKTPLKNCNLWLAQYTKREPLPPPAWKSYSFWQYSNGTLPLPSPAPVPGIGKCDRDKFNGSLDELHKLWGVA